KIILSDPNPYFGQELKGILSTRYRTDRGGALAWLDQQGPSSNLDAARSYIATREIEAGNPVTATVIAANVSFLSPLPSVLDRALYTWMVKDPPAAQEWAIKSNIRETRVAEAVVRAETDLKNTSPEVFAKKMESTTSLQSADAQQRA